MFMKKMDKLKSAREGKVILQMVLINIVIIIVFI